MNDYGGLLKKLVHCEAKEAEWGSKASKIRKEICEKYADFHKDDLVIVVYKKDGRQKRGIISQVNYRPRSSSAINGFTYVIFSVRKGETKSDNFRLVHYYDGDRIEKFEDKMDKGE